MPTVTASQKTSINNTLTASWTGLAAGDDGSAIATNGKKTSVQVLGTFGSSTVTMQGSNDGTNWVNLNDEAVPANSCSFTAAGFKGVLQMPKYIRPMVSAGTGSGLSVLLINR